LLEGNKETNLIEEENQGIIERYEELDEPFLAMQSIGANVLDVASADPTQRSAL
jgi:hypothetical protein